MLVPAVLCPALQRHFSALKKRFKRECSGVKGIKTRYTLSEVIKSGVGANKTIQTYLNEERKQNMMLRKVLTTAPFSLVSIHHLYCASTQGPSPFRAQMPHVYSWATMGNDLGRFLGASCNTATANDGESIDRVV